MLNLATFGPCAFSASAVRPVSVQNIQTQHTAGTADNTMTSVDWLEPWPYSTYLLSESFKFTTTPWSAKEPANENRAANQSAASQTIGKVPNNRSTTKGE
jgi:hypothetical protein